MSSYTTILLLLSAVILLVRGVPVTNNIADICDAHFYANGNPCGGIISASNICKASKIDLGNTNVSTCTSVRLSWPYPIDNLTMTIETPFTQKQQAYTISIDNERFKGAISRVFRVFNGQETEVTTTDAKLIQYSDVNYQVILKFQAPPTISYYLVYINYEVTKM